MKGVTVGLTTAYSRYQLFTVSIGLIYDKKSSPAFKQECGGGKLLSYIVFTENGKAKDEGKILLLEVSRNCDFAVLPCRYHNA